MKKFGMGLSIAAVVLAAAMVLSMIPSTAANTETGNGAPSGAHYNLNIIGVSKGKNVDGIDNGNRIFVWENGKTNINLEMTDTFQVIDAIGTDSNGATLGLPDPYSNGFDPADPQPVYRIYVRALGKPSGKAYITPAFYDETGTPWYSVYSVTVERKKGQSVFSDETIKLTTITCDYNSDGQLETVRLFDPMYDQYFWEYDNYGLKHAQLRFYMC